MKSFTPSSMVRIFAYVKHIGIHILRSKTIYMTLLLYNRLNGTFVQDNWKGIYGHFYVNQYISNYDSHGNIYTIYKAWALIFAETHLFLLCIFFSRNDLFPPFTPTKWT